MQNRNQSIPNTRQKQLASADSTGVVITKKFSFHFWSLQEMKML